MMDHYLRPTFGAALAESAGMFVGANAGAITIVVKLNEIGAPPQEHRMPGAQHHVDGGDQKVGPAFDGAERSGSPVKLPGELGHFAVADDAI
jgi:hypothetical protein